MTGVTEKKDNLVLDLFKYYAPKYKEEYNLSFNTKNAVYFQQPKEFNDPYDCRLPEILLPRSKRQLKEIWPFLWGQESEDARISWKEIEQKQRSEIIQNIREPVKHAVENLRSEIGVFSLSFLPDSELMWSHYAESHTGYMLHFQIDMLRSMNDFSLKDISLFAPVIYREKRDAWHLIDYYKEKNKHIYDLIRFKSSAWEYECEFRLLHVNRYGFVRIPDNWLKSIIIGLNASDDLREKLVDIGKRLNVPVFHSTINKKEYKIDIPGFGVTGEDGKRLYEKIVKSKIFEFNKGEYHVHSR